MDSSPELAGPRGPGRRDDASLPGAIPRVAMPRGHVTGLHWAPSGGSELTERAQAAGLHAFVGRAPELATLLAALDAAARGAGSVQLLRGEAGIGKSRTAQEVAAAARARGFAVGIGMQRGDAAPPTSPGYARWKAAPRGTRWKRASRSARGEAKTERRARADALFRQVEAALRADAAERPRLRCSRPPLGGRRLLRCCALARALQGAPGSRSARCATTRPSPSGVRGAHGPRARRERRPARSLRRGGVATLVAPGAARRRTRSWAGRAPAQRRQSLFLCE